MYYLAQTRPCRGAWWFFCALVGLVSPLALVGEVLADGQDVLQCKALTESSGVCVSSSSGVIWSHNDSGGKAKLYGFDQAGALVAEVKLRSVKAIDWEDICAFEFGGQAYLAVGDIGDNQRKRKRVQIHVLKEPALKKGKPAPSELKADVICTLDVRYPGGAVDCESLAYDPVKKAFLLASKEPFRSRFFEIPLEGLKSSKLVAKSGASVAALLVTGADISRDGSLLVLSTYGPACLLRRTGEGGQWGVAAPHWFPVPARKQGEAICFADADRQIFLTSEHAPTPLFKIPIPVR